MAVAPIKIPDIGGAEGFDEDVELTLTYDEDLIPEGTTEEDLVVAFFNEADLNWEQVPVADLITIDTSDSTQPLVKDTQGAQHRCEPIPDFLMQRVRLGGLLPELKQRLSQKHHV